MAKATKNLFTSGQGDNSKNIKDKQTIEKLIQEVKKRLDNPEDAQKAAIIIEQWLHEINDQKQKKKSA